MRSFLKGWRNLSARLFWNNLHQLRYFLGTSCISCETLLEQIVSAAILSWNNLRQLRDSWNNLHQLRDSLGTICISCDTFLEQSASAATLLEQFASAAQNLPGKESVNLTKVVCQLYIPVEHLMKSPRTAPVQNRARKCHQQYAPLCQLYQY